MQMRIDRLVLPSPYTFLHFSRDHFTNSSFSTYARRTFASCVNGQPLLRDRLHVVLLLTLDGLQRVEVEGAIYESKSAVEILGRVEEFFEARLGPCGAGAPSANSGRVLAREA